MSAQQNATFLVTENVGINDAERVPSKNGTFLTAENIGINESERVASKDSTFFAGENVGINDDEFIQSIISQRPVGWGVSPHSFEDVSLRKSPSSVFGTFENIYDDQPPFVNVGETTLSNVSATQIALPAGSGPNDFFLLTMNAAGAASSNDSRIIGELDAGVGPGKVYYGLLTTGDPISVSIDATAFNRASAALSVLRGVTYGSHTTTSGSSGSSVATPVEASKKTLVAATLNCGTVDGTIGTPTGYVHHSGPTGTRKPSAKNSLWTGAGPNSPSGTLTLSGTVQAWRVTTVELVPVAPVSEWQTAIEASVPWAWYQLEPTTLGIGEDWSGNVRHATNGWTGVSPLQPSLVPSAPDTYSVTKTGGNLSSPSLSIDLPAGQGFTFACIIKNNGTGHAGSSPSIMRWSGIFFMTRAPSGFPLDWGISFNTLDLRDTGGLAIIENNQPHLLMACVKNGEQRLYRDGLLVDSKTHVGYTAGVLAAIVEFGGAGATSKYNGGWDECLVWDRMLSHEEAVAIGSVWVG